MKITLGALSILLANAVFVSNTYASTAKFNHAGVQAGKIVENCYHNPCSGVKIVKFNQLDKSAHGTMLELTVLGYHRDWDLDTKFWNTTNHKLYIICSIQNPTVIIDDKVTIVPISEAGVPGVLYTDYTIYSSACHGEYMDEGELSRRYGYNVKY